jgi:multidrug resistance efflux pump
MKSRIGIRWLAGGVVVMAAVLVLLLRPRGDEGRTWLETVRVDTGPMPVTLRELGVLAPRDPVLAKAPFNARLQWVIEDGIWVEAGANLFILSDEDEVKRIAEMRSQLVQGRAELRLARLKREHGEQIERPKLAAAERALALAEIRRRLVEARPVGGMELVAIADAVRPLAATTAAARRAAESTQDAYQAGQDGYLAALDVWQANRDRILRLQARLDELDAGGDAQAADAEKAKTERMAQIAGITADLDVERAHSGELSAAAARARAERDALQQPRDAAATALAAAEAAEADLRFRAEVEKRGLPLARLQLDERQAVVDLAETRRTVEQTRVAVTSGSVARSELERLTDQLARQENALEVVRTRIAMASRPPDARTLAEADAQLVQARTTAEDARGAYDRAIALLDQDLALREAQVERLERQIDQRSAGFPSVLESGIRFAERELALLGPDEAEERSGVEAQLTRLRAQYELASGSPPNVVKAPVAGLVRVQRNGDRQRQAGDQCWEQDPMIEIYPPENMDVLLRINEVDVAHLSVGLAAQVVIPALKDLEMHGEIAQIAGVGRDKFSRPEYAGKAGFADVVDFEARVHLSGTKGVELRQGMAARVGIELSRHDGLRLPLAAVEHGGDGIWQVRRPGNRRQQIEGHPVGAEWFEVSAGLAVGDEVVIERTRNR